MAWSPLPDWILLDKHGSCGDKACSSPLPLFGCCFLFQLRWLKPEWHEPLNRAGPFQTVIGGLANAGPSGERSPRCSPWLTFISWSSSREIEMDHRLNVQIGVMGCHPGNGPPPHFLLQRMSIARNGLQHAHAVVFGVNE